MTNVLEDKMKSKAKERNCRRVMARYYHPVRQECSVRGCSIIGERHHPDPDKWKEIVWLCKKHHTREHNRIRLVRICKVNGCNTKHDTGGYCSAHFKRKSQCGLLRHRKYNEVPRPKHYNIVEQTTYQKRL